MDSPRRYRKLPVEVLALKWTGDNWPAVKAFAGKHVVFHGGDIDVWIEKSKTWRQAMPVGDWIIAEIDGHGVYPCPAEAFPVIHEAIEE
jgi:hypothetical protein